MVASRRGTARASLALLAVGDVERAVGACATPSARAAASSGFISGIFAGEPFAKTSKLPDGLPFANGWNVTL